MGYGTLDADQERVVHQFVEARAVHDLGAGDLSMARTLLKLGAGRVVAVDSKFPHYSRGRKKVEGIDLCETYFRDFKDKPEMALVSWPVNYDGIGLVEIVRRTPTVLYVGTNTGGTACGGDDLWQHLVTREVLSYIPCRQNTLIVYGPKKSKRLVYGEELAALDRSPMGGKMWMFEEAEKASQAGVSALSCGATFGQGVVK